MGKIWCQSSAVKQLIAIHTGFHVCQETSHKYATNLADSYGINDDFTLENAWGSQN
jgi:hypothetical protein